MKETPQPTVETKTSPESNTIFPPHKPELNGIKRRSKRVVHVDADLSRPCATKPTRP